MAQDRKLDHIEMTFNSQTGVGESDSRFFYEPLFGSHNTEATDISCEFLGSHLQAPIWISSMTGGTELAKSLNKRLAIACGKFGLGMGLGSCRILLESDRYFEDFNVREFLGNQPLYANLGVAQVEKMANEKSLDRIEKLIEKLKADGLILHINPLQEWYQPEGDRFQNSPLETINELRKTFKGKLIIKEVGQGFGPHSLKALMSLDIDAIDFGAFGGTNFSKLEIQRSKEASIDQQFAFVGHTADEMVGYVNQIISQSDDADIKCRNFIISGGVKDFLDGYYLTEKTNAPAIFAQASKFLGPALESQEELNKYIENMITGFKLSKQFLKVR